MSGFFYCNFWCWKLSFKERKIWPSNHLAYHWWRVFNKPLTENLQSLMPKLIHKLNWQNFRLCSNKIQSRVKRNNAFFQRRKARWSQQSNKLQQIRRFKNWKSFETDRWSKIANCFSDKQKNTSPKLTSWTSWAHSWNPNGSPVDNNKCVCVCPLGRIQNRSSQMSPSSNQSDNFQYCGPILFEEPFWSPFDRLNFQCQQRKQCHSNYRFVSFNI